MAAKVVAELIVGSAEQLAEEEGFSFAPTPGPGDSEGGDVYAPEGTGHERANNACVSTRGVQELGLPCKSSESSAPD